MDIKYENGNTIINGLRDFDLEHIFDCGQAFRFNRVDENTYFGIAFKKALKISQYGDSAVLYDTSPEDFFSIWKDCFDLDRDYGKIKDTLSCDDVMREAVRHGGGIRILKQDLWETVISFIISQSNNIPRIKGIIERFCESFGEEIHYMGKTYHAFPTAEKTASLTKEDLSVIRAGFRDKYIMDAARVFSEKILTEDMLKQASTDMAKRLLMSVKGIGGKVSDCILLFGLGRADSFPVDVWIKRIMEHCYFDCEQSIKTISDLAQKKFGSLGGYAQQYLFFYARDTKIGVQ